MKAALFFLLAVTFGETSAWAGPFAPAAGQPGSTAIAADDPAFVGWATAYTDFNPGPQNIANPALGLASFGSPSNALGPSDVNLSSGYTSPVVSLGDGGSITLTFARPIVNGPGADFAVFENSFSDTFLELAFVEVSSDGQHFFRFPAISDTQTTIQVGGFDTLDPTNLYDLAGKYRGGYGTPFDLAELAADSGPNLNLDDITEVRVEDVVGSIDPLYATHDSLGNIVNDPWPTPYSSSGFDLDAVGVINQQIPEPASGLLFGSVAALFCGRRRKRA
jgi:hypothetical protein